MITSEWALRLTLILLGLGWFLSGYWYRQYKDLREQIEGENKWN